MGILNVISTKTLGTSEVVVMNRYGDGSIEFIPKLVTTGNRTSGSATLAAVASFSGISVGDPISGTGIPAGTTVAAKNSGASTITMSANATSGSATSTTITITKAGGGVGQDWTRSPATCDGNDFYKKLFDALYNVT